jgi:NAD dependent epimerase/dehydratase family enzyme
MQIVRKTSGAVIGLPAAKWMLEIGAVFMQTETELILKSRRVAPGRLLKEGFSFQFPDWPSACKDLYRRWKANG